MKGTIPRRAETLGALNELLANPDGSDQAVEHAETLGRALCRAPRNRAEMRDQIKAMGRRARIAAGFGTIQRRSLVMELPDPWVKP